MGAITVTNLGKAYKHYPTRWSRLAEWVSPGHKPHHTLTWALQDINFMVNPGEAVGIVGINGAGKSTLLKMITGTTQPTTGSAHITGRIAALLELGMGFHPDFTGRQNVFMAGQLLGCSVEEIGRLMPDIEAFAEIGDYIDQLVRVYSSGMQMRLAFAVATAFRPDVLIVDEALSVGDAYFQHKSFQQIRKFQKQGTTLLIVSHDRGAILSLCDRVVLLGKGCLLMDGPPAAVMDYYNALIAEQESSTITQNQEMDTRVQTISGTGEVLFDEITLLDEQGRSVETIEAGSAVTLQLRISVVKTVSELDIGYMIQDRLGRTIFGTNTYHQKRTTHDLSAGQQLVYTFAFTANLGPGSYSITVAAHVGSTHLQRNFEWRDLALIFEIVNTSHPEFVGCNWLEPTVAIEQYHG